jgi:hypothetical protein
MVANQVDLLADSVCSRGQRSAFFNIKLASHDVIHLQGAPAERLY